MRGITPSIIAVLALGGCAATVAEVKPAEVLGDLAVESSPSQSAITQAASREAAKLDSPSTASQQIDFDAMITKVGAYSYTIRRAGITPAIAALLETDPRVIPHYKGNRSPGAQLTSLSPRGVAWASSRAEARRGGRSGGFGPGRQRL